jgi:hypothetical protein
MRRVFLSLVAFLALLSGLNFAPQLNSQTPTTGPFATTAKVEVNDSKGKIALKREEEVAFMFLSAIEEIERECIMNIKRACTLQEALAGSNAPGAQYEHLKYDPNKVDPNYTYMLWTNGTAYEAHATPKKPGFSGFYMVARDGGITIATINPKGIAGWTSDQLMNRGVMGDSFAVQ